MKAHAMTLLALFLLVAVSCYQDSAPEQDFASDKAPSGPSLAKMEMNGSGAEAVAPTSTLADRKLIRQATLEIEVETVDDAARAAAEIANRHGGVLADSEFFQNADGEQRGTVRLAVPADRFADVVEELKPLGTVRLEQTDTEDVTRAYADLEIRLAVKRDTADRLRDILENRTGKLSDVLQVERELSRVIEEIERMEGQIRYYDRQVAISSITVRLYEPGMGDPGPFAAVTRAFGAALRVLAESVAAIVYITVFLVPWLLVAGLVGWVVVRLRRRAVAGV
jgi:hypothetical protein